MSYAAPRTEEERKIAKLIDDSYTVGWNEAIEECAQVVADRADWTSDRDLGDTLLAAAAAIRALKDKPLVEAASEMLTQDNPFNPFNNKDKP